jgi:hypothetical protein
MYEISQIANQSTLGLLDPKEGSTTVLPNVGAYLQSTKR